MNLNQIPTAREMSSSLARLSNGLDSFWKC